jgi:hypothetical protein
MSVDTLRNNPEELIIKLDNLGDFAEPLNTLFKSRNL